MFVKVTFVASRNNYTFDLKIFGSRTLQVFKEFLEGCL